MVFYAQDALSSPINSIKTSKETQSTNVKKKKSRTSDIIS